MSNPIERAYLEGGDDHRDCPDWEPGELWKRADAKRDAAAFDELMRAVTELPLTAEHLDAVDRSDCGTKLYTALAYFKEMR